MKNYLKDAEDHIRENWFSKHVAKVEGEEGLQVITWGKPGTFMYRTKYVLSGNNVFISGDTGEAVYTLTCAATLKNIKGFNLSYFTGKLSAFCEDRWNFNRDVALRELKEYWKEHEMGKYHRDSRDIYEGIKNAIDEASTLESYRAWLMPVWLDTSIDDLEGIWDFGKEMPYRLIGYWVGLQMAIEQLEP